MTGWKPKPEPALPRQVGLQRDSRMRRRNLVVLGILVALVVFAFILSFSHVALEAGGAVKQTQG